MKIKKSLFENVANPFGTAFWVGIIAIGLLTGCKKVETTNVSIVPNITSQTTIASDEITVNDQLDQLVDDAIAALYNHHASIAGSYGVDSVPRTTYVLEITYSGTPEPDGVESRTGVDSIHYNLKIPWSTKGATATISFHDISDPTGYEAFYGSILSYSATPSAIVDTASLSFLGGATITNVYGGTWPTAPGDSLVVHIVANNISYTFNDQAAVIQLYSLKVNRIRVYTITGSTMYATTRGDTTIDGSPLKNVSNWGTNRFSNNYYTTIGIPIVQNISNLTLSYNPLAGSKNIEEIAEPIYSMYGVTSQDLPANGTPYGFYTRWTNNGVQALVTLPYYY